MPLNYRVKYGVVCIDFDITNVVGFLRLKDIGHLSAFAHGVRFNLNGVVQKTCIIHILLKR